MRWSTERMTATLKQRIETVEGRWAKPQAR